MRVYLDHNATTPLRPEVRALLEELAPELGANPSSLHSSGRRLRQRIDAAREQAAAALRVHEDELVFVSGGTESNALALHGVLEAAGAGSGLLTSAVEHSCVLENAALLERRGHQVARVSVDRTGRLDLEACERVLGHLGGRCALVSVQAANNEVGTLQPLDELGQVLRELPDQLRPLFHSDLVQAVGRVPLQLDAWGLDLASISAHKFGGPLGVGLLWVRQGTALVPQLVGGGQERGLRAGTENSAAIAGAALALELALAEQTLLAARWRSLSMELWGELNQRLKGVRLNGPGLDSGARLPNTLNLSIPGADGKVLVMRLDLAGLEVSAGSACASGSLEASHVLLAMGLSEEQARAGLRLSLGRTTSAADCKRAVEILCNLFAPSHAT